MKEQRQLADQVLSTLDDAVIDRLSARQVDEMRRHSKLWLPPGHGPDPRVERLGQLREYDRIVNLKGRHTTSGQLVARRIAYGR
jgi:hypothetical protein